MKFSQLFFLFLLSFLSPTRRTVVALLSQGEAHCVVLYIALAFLSFLRFLSYSVDWTSVGHSLRCGSLGLETSTLNSFVSPKIGHLGFFFFFFVLSKDGGIFYRVSCISVPSRKLSGHPWVSFFFRYRHSYY